MDEIVVTLRPGRKGTLFASWNGTELLCWPSRRAHVEAASVLHHSHAVALERSIAFRHGDGPVCMRATMADLIRAARIPPLEVPREGLALVKD
ncbi:hypothetical protein [Microvirga sesbaniae]|uniref:hypothetical protein n=1 Tax=Microvirga sesbaniae TaxID=681392 RepID=UPI0021C7B50A|nr:hypothetical protein [Microvirga sp. HBU67692]